MSREFLKEAIQWLQLAILLFLLFRITKANLAASRRGQEIADFCRKKGFRFSPRASQEMWSKGFKLLRTFNPLATEIRNCMYGTSGAVEFVVADYVYATGQGASWYNYNPNYGTIWILRSDDGREEMPVFYLAKRSVHYKEFNRHFSFCDIKLSNVNEEFRRNYIVNGLREQEVKDFFDEEVCNLFMSFAQENYCCETCGKYMIFFVPNDLELTERLRLLEYFEKIFAAIHDVPIEKRELNEVADEYNEENEDKNGDQG